MEQSSGKKRIRLCLAVAALGILIACSSVACVQTSSDDLPSSHVNADGMVNVGHERCGACHIGGLRD